MAFPCFPSTILSNKDYEIAARLNLGLIPYDTLPLFCSSCHRKSHPLESISLQDDPWHYLSCPARRNNEGAIRHHQINKSISKLVNIIGGLTVLEPPSLHPNNKLRPDQQILLDNQEFILDVSVIHPTCPSYLPYDFTQRGLGSAEFCANKKISKYQELMNGRNLEEKQSIFIPFIMETYGGINKLGQNLMKHLIVYSQQNQFIWTQEEIKYLLRFNLSIAIQRGNAALCRMGYSSDTYLFSRRNSV